MKPAMAQKPSKTALWPRRIFSAPTPAKTAGRNFAMEKNRFAKEVRRTAGCQVAGGEWPDEKLPSSVVSRLSSALRLRWYSLRLRFKRSDRPKVQGLKSKAFPAKKANRSRCSFYKPARMAT